MAAELADALAPLEGHGEVLAGLRRAARATRLAHALLFSGPGGIGKFLAARHFAAWLLCSARQEDGACGACGACRRVRAGSHPDLFVVDLLEIEPDERPEVLQIGRFVRRAGDGAYDGPTVDEFLALRAFEGGWRVVLVREIERANAAAQNSILKMLEEPSERVLWVLEGSRPRELLATIRSRCIDVRFRPLDDSATVRVLTRHGIDAHAARELAHFGRGSPGEALRARRQALPTMRAVLAELAAGRAEPLTVSRAVWELEGEFEGKTPKAVERERARAFLDLALKVALEGERARAGAPPESLAHRELLAAARFDAAGLRAACDELLRLRRDIDFNVDPPMVVDRACMAVDRAARRPAPPSAAARAPLR
jgi:DNA polymerase-3 subunit delta'